MSKPPYPWFGTQSSPCSRRVSGSVRLKRSEAEVLMSQVFVDHIRTVIEPDFEGVLGEMNASMSTPYSVSFWKRRSTLGHATVASRPTG